MTPPAQPEHAKTQQSPMDCPTSLSPRLRHLLIVEDRKTGKLYLPIAGQSTAKPSSPGSPIRRLSPPVSPFAFPISPVDRASQSPRQQPPVTRFPPTLPPSLERSLPDPLDRRPSSSISSLLSEGSRPLPSPLSSQPLASTSYAVEHRGSRYEHPNRASAPSISFTPYPGSGSYAAPLTCPILPTDGSNSPFVPSSHYQTARPSTTSALIRPNYSRRPSGEIRNLYRHSVAPYPSPRPVSMAMSSTSHHASSSRAPISRTTKACNACRNRKVRCDAGGPGAPEGQSCGRCRDGGIECEYSGVQRKRGPCPGSLRLGTGQKARRPSSNRSSVTSLAPVTPPEDSSSHNLGRRSYDFSQAAHLSAPSGSNPFRTHRENIATSLPSQGPHWQSYPAHREAPLNFGPLTPRHSDSRFRPSQPEQIHSWPGPVEFGMEPRPVVFDEHYTMSTVERPKPKPDVRKEDSLVLPPLRVAIGERDVYYE